MSESGDNQELGAKQLIESAFQLPDALKSRTIKYRREPVKEAIQIRKEYRRQQVRDNQNREK